MKNYDLLRVVRTGVLSLSLATLALAIPAAAQNNDSPNTTTSTTTTRSETRDDRRDDGRDYRRDDRRDDDTDWGWLGLLGLGGLLGLMPRKREAHVVRQANVGDVHDRNVHHDRGAHATNLR